jgi:hypothetical protein
MSSTKHDDIAAPIKDRSHHIFCPFFGGADDRYALRLVLQLAENSDVTATIVHFETDDGYFHADEIAEVTASITPVRSQTGKADATVTHTQTPPGERDTVFFLSLKNSIPAGLAGRVVFETVSAASRPIKAVLERAGEEVGQHPHNAGDLVILGRNASRLGAFTREAAKDGAEARKCLGAVGNELVISSLRTSVIVVQAQSNEWE